MTRLLLFITISFFTLQLQAQTVEDALRYSRLDFGGTARSMGIGGAMGALGTDFSVLSTNPAGLAAYRSSDFMITPSFKFMNVSSELGGDTEDRRSSKLLLDNIGFVVATQPLASAWESMNFGIGINKIADFNREIYYEGTSQGSIVDRFAEQADGRELDELYPFEEGLAFDTEALFETGPGSYGSDFQDAPNASISRNETIETTGYINELVFSFAANLKHKLMMGLTVGVPILRYSLNRTYSERNIGEEIPNFNDLTFTENITTSGAGFNLKLGIIYRPIQMVRIGLAVHTPTVYGLTDQWENTMNYDYTFDGVNSDITETALNGGPFEYNLRTPGRAIGSLAFLFKKRGFLSAEVEYLDYTGNSFNLTSGGNTDTGTEQYERSLNQEIEDNFDSAINLRLGGELAFDIFRIRAGYGLFGTSYADKSSFDPAYSLGLGMREKSYYLDLAYRLTTTSEDYTPYRLVDPTREQQVTAESSISKIIFTLGFRF